MLPDVVVSNFHSALTSRALTPDDINWLWGQQSSAFFKAFLILGGQTYKHYMAYKISD